jgi:hypothetical protein
MAIPAPLDATKIQYLQDIIDKCTAEDLGDFPMPTKDDFALIGALVVIYSYIDFNMLRIVGVMDQAQKVGEKYRGKTDKLRTYEIEEVVKSADWSEKNLEALDRISELRLVRNLFGHFTIRRFPNHDAYFLTTKDARDFKKIFKRVPEKGIAMTVVMEAKQLKDAVKEAEQLVAWFSKAASGYEEQWLRTLNPDVAE